jgi:hypothetical protein
VSHIRGWLAALAVTLVTVGLSVGEIDDTGFRHWWAGHPLTTDTVAGLLVLLITVQVVDQVVRLRQVRDRSRATAAQAAIVMAQATRASRVVSAVVSGQRQREDALAEMRTYAMMLLVAAPVLIEAKAARDFLEESQRLAGEMARVMSILTSGKGKVSSARMDEAARQVKAAATPLLQPLRLEELIVAGAHDTSTVHTSEDPVPDRAQDPAEDPAQDPAST